MHAQRYLYTLYDIMYSFGVLPRFVRRFPTDSASESVVYIQICISYTVHTVTSITEPSDSIRNINFKKLFTLKANVKLHAERILLQAYCHVPAFSQLQYICTRIHIRRVITIGSVRQQYLFILFGV